MHCRRDKILKELFKAGFSTSQVRSIKISYVATVTYEYYTPKRECLGRDLPESLQDDLELYLNLYQGRPFLDYHPKLKDCDLLFPSPVTGRMLTTRRIQGIKKSAARLVVNRAVE